MPLRKPQIKRYKVLSLFLTVLLAGCATVPKGAEEKPAVLKELCERYGVAVNLDPVSQVVTLTKNNLTAKVLINSDIVLFGQEKIFLSGKLKREKSTLYVPPDFKLKVIDRFKEGEDYVLKKLYQIVIDPGHGGKDPGARSRTGLEEKSVVLDIGKRLKEDLKKEGIDVIMTRDRDEFISLKGRTEIASRSKADLFVSIHANSSRQKHAEGFEVYYLRELNSRERREDDLRDNHKIKFKNLSMDKGSPVLDKILTDMMYDYKQGESRRLAEYLMMKTPRNLEMEGRGSKPCGFFVLRNSLIPAILVEVGFVSNPKEERLLKTSSYRQKVADTLAKHILEYANKE